MRQDASRPRGRAAPLHWVVRKLRRKVVRGMPSDVVGGFRSELGGSLLRLANLGSGGERPVVERSGDDGTEQREQS